MQASASPTFIRCAAARGGRKKKRLFFTIDIYVNTPNVHDRVVLCKIIIGAIIQNVVTMIMTTMIIIIILIIIIIIITTTTTTTWVFIFFIILKALYL